MESSLVFVSIRTSPYSGLINEFVFESYGVRVRIESDSIALLEEARKIAYSALVGRLMIVEKASGIVEHTFSIGFDGSDYILHINDELISQNESPKVFFKYFNSRLRLAVAEYAESRIFLHAGVVGWKGQAIVIPANSYAGKTTLVAELVKNGAEYFSDEYAVLDKSGFVHPFPRDLSVRYAGGAQVKPVSVRELGGMTATASSPVGMVLVTSYEKDGSWSPEVLTPGIGILEIIPHTIPMVRNTELSMKVLDLIARRAIIVKSPRGDAKSFAKTLLEFFEDYTNLAKVM